MKYRHLGIDEREIIQVGIVQGYPLRVIARAIRRSVATVSRELSRHSSPEKRIYTPHLAHERALVKRTSRGRTERLKSDAIRGYVIAKLKERWSPEQISDAGIAAVEYALNTRPRKRLGWATPLEAWSVALGH